MEITVIRHGQTIENQQGICQGQSDGTLSRKGIEQANTLKESLKDEDFDLVITSDLQRSVDTANIIFSGSNAEIVLDKRLRERGLHTLQGKSLDKSIDWCGEIDGCEQMEELFARVRELLHEVKNRHSDSRVAIVSHGITIRVIESICQGLDVDKTTVVDNCSLNIFTIL